MVLYIFKIHDLWLKVLSMLEVAHKNSKSEFTYLNLSIIRAGPSVTNSSSKILGILELSYRF